VGCRPGLNGAQLKRGEVWWADLGAYRPRGQTGRRPVVTWQSDVFTRAFQSVLVIPLTTNLDRANLAGCAPFRNRRWKPRSDESELEELELATVEGLGRVEPK
jgi:hypothetical protein